MERNGYWTGKGQAHFIHPLVLDPQKSGWLLKRAWPTEESVTAGLLMWGFATSTEQFSVLHFSQRFSISAAGPARRDELGSMDAGLHCAFQGNASVGTSAQVSMDMIAGAIQKSHLENRSRAVQSVEDHDRVHVGRDSPIPRLRMIRTRAPDMGGPDGSEAGIKQQVGQKRTPKRIAMRALQLYQGVHRSFGRLQ